MTGPQGRTGTATPRPETQGADGGIEPRPADNQPQITMDDGPGPARPGQSASPSTPNRDKARDIEFDLFYRADTPQLIVFLMMQGASAAEAEDIAQEAMLAAYQRWGAIDRPKAWVRTVGKRLWWRKLQREVPQSEISNEQLPVGTSSPLLPSGEGEAEETETRHVFLSLIRALPQAQREVMAWIYDGYLPTEIAEATGKNPATVRSHLRAARRALRDQLQDLHSPPNSPPDPEEILRQDARQAWCS